MFLSVFGTILLVVTPFVLIRWGIYHWRRKRIIKNDEKLRRQAQRELDMEDGRW